MTEINVTALMSDNLTDYSDSVANSGLENIGEITWRNAMERAAEDPIVPSEHIDTAKDWIRDFGAWDDAEIDGWSEVEVNALVIQFVAGDGQRYLEALEGEEGEIERYLESEGGRLNLDADSGEWWFLISN